MFNEHGEQYNYETTKKKCVNLLRSTIRIISRKYFPKIILQFHLKFHLSLPSGFRRKMYSLSIGCVLVCSFPPITGNQTDGLILFKFGMHVYLTKILRPFSLLF